jgi:hypothetical protein
LERNARLMAEADGEVSRNPLSIGAQADPERGATLVTIYASDHPGLFYRIAGAIHLAGGNIIDARIHTTRDGMALDNLLVQDPFGRPSTTRIGCGGWNLDRGCAGQPPPARRSPRGQARRAHPRRCLHDRTQCADR